ncbi:MAG: undecaprenyl-diphosphate phosphatase [Aestuariivirgaceae bacterium]
MLIEQIIVLAVIQGITEFLPISSSGHLILVPALTGWPDQGLITDVMVHMGSFLAVLVYFRRDVALLIGGGLNLLRGRMSDHGRMALYILAATVPAVAFGLTLKKTGVIDAIRGPEIVAWNAIIFGIIMYVADRFGDHAKVMEDMKLSPAVIVGIAQAIAIIPGTSRSGITMSAARALGFSRPESARFSFLLGIPAIAGAGVLVLGEALQNGEAISFDAVVTGALTFFTALAAIAFLMALVRRMSLLPFVIYRLILGVLLLWLVYSGTLAGTA